MGNLKPPRQEFERKFLPILRFLPETLPKPKRLVQGYLAFEPTSVRIRVTDGKKAVVECKGPDQFESDPLAMPVDQAFYALEHGAKAHGSLIEKQRHVLPARGGLKWELDRFEGANAQLVLLEIETPTAGYALDPAKFPPFVGLEVTDDKRFKNKNLARRPFLTWPDAERLEILSLMAR
jgi:adenylate cyclase